MTAVLRCFFVLCIPALMAQAPKIDWSRHKLTNEHCRLADDIELVVIASNNPARAHRSLRRKIAPLGRIINDMCDYPRPQMPEGVRATERFAIGVSAADADRVREILENFEDLHQLKAHKISQKVSETIVQRRDTLRGEIERGARDLVNVPMAAALARDEIRRLSVEADRIIAARGKRLFRIIIFKHHEQ